MKARNFGIDTTLLRRIFATRSKKENAVHQDYIGSPDLISNLRPVKYYARPSETAEERTWRLHRERVDKFNQDFWETNNKLFKSTKMAFENAVLARNGKKPSSSEMSAFYGEFLDKAYDRHRAYNKQWWKENAGMLLPALKAAIRNLQRSR
ncbi:4173_t:CDS:2 [Paraglomus brasilianum]|uniref:4173_t:CDS:1 n=1 Tax=Paraglomus brasilianum TaxID=144538 RepID=A0A9N9B328_9GLOM|nr:4173_t:CDS:2 [Paraglomus brasilianum]